MPSSEDVAERARALLMLANCPDGATETALTGRGVSIELIVELVTSGPATTATHYVRTGGHQIAVTRVLITNEGRSAIGAEVKDA